MRSLRELQQDFADALAGPRHPVPAFAPTPGGSAAERIAIYRNAVHANYCNALSATYPVVRRLVGTAFFDAAVDAYVRAHPSPCGDLNVYGDAFGEFLARLSACRRPCRTSPTSRASSGRSTRRSARRTPPARPASCSRRCRRVPAETADRRCDCAGSVVPAGRIGLSGAAYLAGEPARSRRRRSRRSRRGGRPSARAPRCRRRNARAPVRRRVRVAFGAVGRRDARGGDRRGAGLPTRASISVTLCTRTSAAARVAVAAD